MRGARWEDDAELFALVRRELFTAVVGDAMDKLGLRRQFLPPRIRPLRDDMVVVGRAMPVLEADVFQESGGGGGAANPLLAKPFGLLFESLDDLKPGEVYVCAGASPRYALWGELMTIRALRLGAAGAVLDGYSRDTPGILSLGFPVFSRGRFAQDQGPRGKVVDYRVPVEIGGARIRPGDLVCADLDGICVVPREAEDETVQAALAKVHGEDLVRRAIEGGMSAAEAFARFGIM